MPFKNDDLSVLAFAKDFTLWHYRSPYATVDEGYFDGGDEMLAPGDMILANLGQGTESRVGIFLITANANGQVSFDDLSDPPKTAPAVNHKPRLERLADVKERQAKQIRASDHTARGEQAAQEADKDAAALRWALRRLVA